MIWTPDLQPISTWLQKPTRGGKWLIPKLLPAESLIIVSGLPKQGFKTWLALWLATMAAGQRGFKSAQGCEWRRPPKPVKTLIYEEEGSQMAAKERLCKVALGLGIPMRVDRVDLPLPEGMDKDDPDRPYDWSPKQTADDPYFDNLLFAHDSGIKLDSKFKLQTVVEQCQKHKAELVIFDALTYMFNGDESDKQAMAQVVDGLKAIRATGASVMYLVHLRKDDDDTDIDKVLRGHTILRDSYDLHLACRRPKDRDAITLHARYRDGKRRKFELYWRIPEEGAMGPVELDLKDIAEEKSRKGDSDTVSVLKSKGWVAGMTYGVSKLARDLSVSEGKAAEIRAALLTADKIRLAPDKSSFVLK